MSKKLDFPSANDFQSEIYQRRDVPETIRQMTDFLSHLCKSPRHFQGDDFQDWMKFSLPTIWSAVANIESHSKQISKEIGPFCEEVVSLLVLTDLPPRPIYAFSRSIDVSKATRYFTAKAMTPSDYENLWKFDAKGRYVRKNRSQASEKTDSKSKEEHTNAKKNRPQISGIISSLISTLFTKGFWTHVRHLVEEKQLVSDKCEAVLRLFVNIQNVIRKRYVIALLPVLTEGGLYALTQNRNNVEIAKHVTEFIKQSPDKLDEALSLFCELSKSGPVHIRMSYTTSIIQITRKSGFGNCGEMVKQTMLQAVMDKNGHHELLLAIFDFLPFLASKIKFEEDDVLSMLSEVESSTSEQRMKCVVGLLSLIKEPLDKFAEKVLNEKIFEPALICNLIGRVSSVEFSKYLFKQLLFHPKMRERRVWTFEMNDQLNSHIKEAMNSEEFMSLVIPLSFFFLSAPNLPLTTEFIEKVIELAREHPDAYNVLDNFSSVLTKFDSSKVISGLVSQVVDALDSPTPNISNMIILLTNWIKAVEKTDVEQSLFKKIKDVPVSCWPEEIYGLVDVILTRQKIKLDLLRKFTGRVFTDTVPEHRAHWALQLYYTLANLDESYAKSCSAYLISHLGDSERHDNAVHMLWTGIHNEADFFQLEGSRCYMQHIIILNEDSIEFDLSLHPFHSTHRIYLAVAKLMHLKVDSFTLEVCDVGQEIELPFRAPLYSYTFSTCKPLQLRIVKEAHRRAEVPKILEKTLFIKSINEPALLSQIFRKINTISFEDELLLQILMLFEPFPSLPGYTNYFQSIFFGVVDRMDDYQEYKRVYPWALRAYMRSKECPDVEMIVQNLADEQYDTVSVSLACASLLQKRERFVFSRETLEICLFSNRKIIRETILALISPDQPKDLLISMIGLTSEPRYRSNSRDFYECLKLFNIDREIFVPFFKNLDQFETSIYGDVDETYIALLSLIPATDETIKLTLSRLFSAPTVKNTRLPFVHTMESWKASFVFLLHPKTVEILPHYIRNIPAIPSLMNKLSDDFSYKGTCGIANLGATCYVNALLQVINGCRSISDKILSLETEGLSPFMLQLRDFLAQLRYGRGGPLSTRQLIDTISGFNVSVQEDAEEFLNKLICKIDKELENGSDITSHMKGTCVSRLKAMDDDSVLAENQEDFYYLSLRIKDTSRLHEPLERYFTETVLQEGYSNGDVTRNAYSHTSVSKWPDYLTIQLQRWDYTLETRERQKLAHEFAFPLELNTRTIQKSTTDNIDYVLTGVVVHQGTAEQGHYVAIVRSEDNEWYVCNDHTIESIEITELSEWAYGAADDSSVTIDSVFTGYLLFYKRNDLEHQVYNIPADLEDKVNRQNEARWPSVVFFSEQFTGFVLDLLIFNLSNDDAVRLALTTMFQIVILREELLEQWTSVMIERVLITEERANLFFDFLEEKIGRNLERIVGLTDTTANDLSKLITTVFARITYNTRPLDVVLRGLNFSSNRRLTSLIYTVIEMACETLSVDWSTEEDVLNMMVSYITMEMPKDSAKNVITQASTVFDLVMQILAKAVRESETVFEGLLILREPHILSRIAPNAKKSESFQKLICHMNILLPDLFTHITPNSHAGSVIAAAMSMSEEYSLMEIDTNIDFIWENMQRLLFSKNENNRKRAAEVAISLLGNPDPTVVDYLSSSITNRSKQRPRFPEESAASLFFIGLISDFCELMGKPKKCKVCDHFISVINQLAYTAPKSLSLFAPEIYNAFSATRDTRLIQVIQRMIAFNPSMTEFFNADEAQSILDLETATRDSIQLLYVFRDKANESNMSGACLELCLNTEFDEYSETMVSMIEEGLVPKNIDIPDQIVDTAIIRFANALWNVWIPRRDELKVFMLRILSIVRPSKLFRKCPSINKAYELLSEYCPEELDKLL